MIGIIGTTWTSEVDELAGPSSYKYKYKYLWSHCDRHFVGQHVELCVVKW